MEKKYSVLIVDDNKDNRLYLKKLFESMDFTIRKASDGKEALEKAKQNKPDFIISDILMPIMDGFKFCIEAKKDYNLKSVPFVFYTATYTSKKDEEFALSLGAVKFIIKPMEPDLFIKEIKKIIEDYEQGVLVQTGKIIKEDKEIFKLYNQRLIHKLEQKTLELEKEIVEHKKSENALSESQLFNQALLDISPELIYVYDIIERKNIYSNSGITKILGYSILDIQAMGDHFLSDLMHLDDFKVYIENIIPLYQKTGDGELIEHQYRMKHKDGRWVWLHSKELIFLRQHDGKPKQIFGLTADISEQKIREEEREVYKENLEKTIKERTEELEDTLKVFVGRELTIKNLEKKIRELERRPE